MPNPGPLASVVTPVGRLTSQVISRGALHVAPWSSLLISWQRTVLELTQSAAIFPYSCTLDG